MKIKVHICLIHLHAALKNVFSFSVVMPVSKEAGE